MVTHKERAIIHPFLYIGREPRFLKIFHIRLFIEDLLEVTCTKVSINSTNTPM